jgi:hypothetical protein
MILYDYDSNAVLAQPIKDRIAPELLKAFQFMEQELLLMKHQEDEGLGHRMDKTAGTLDQH